MAALRTLVITERSELSSGVGKHGAPWTLYGAKVADAEGTLLDERFKTFEALPLHEPLQLEVERQVHEQHGVSYLLSRPKSGSLRHRVGELETQVKRLGERLALLEGKS